MTIERILKFPLTGCRKSIWFFVLLLAAFLGTSGLVEATGSNEKGVVKGPETKLSRWNIFKKLGCNQPKLPVEEGTTLKPTLTTDVSSSTCEPPLVETITSYATTTATIPVEPCTCLKDGLKKARATSTCTSTSFEVTIPPPQSLSSSSCTSTIPVCSCGGGGEHGIIFVSSTSTIHKVYTVTQELETSTIIKFVTKQHTSTLTLQCTSIEATTPTSIVCKCTCTQRAMPKDRSNK